MTLKKIIFLCLFLGSSVSPLLYGYDSLYWKVTDALKKYQKYNEDYNTTINALSKKTIIEPLIFAIITTWVSKKIFYPQRGRRQIYNFDNRNDAELLSLAAGISSFFITFYTTKKIIERSPTIQEWIDPEKAADALYYKTKRDETIENLKKYIKTNKISREQIDQIRHELSFWESSQKKILYDLAKDLPKK